MAGTRFCEECGTALTPGKKFCEECGAVVPPEPGIPATRAQAGHPSPDVPLAVIPFGSQPRGVISIQNLILVMYPGQMVLASVPEQMSEAFEQADEQVYDLLDKKSQDGRKYWEAVASGAGLFGETFYPPVRWTLSGAHENRPEPGMLPPSRPWERYLSMTPAMVLAEDSRNRAIPWGSITYMRGDWEGPSGVLLIRVPEGTIRIDFSNGIYHLARRVLFSFLVTPDGAGETVAGLLPEAEEPHVDDLFYQWYWMIVVTDRRIWFVAPGDDEDGEGGQDLAEELKQRPVSDMIRFGGTFFVPLEAIRRVTIVPVGLRKKELVTFELTGETLSMKLEKGMADKARAVLGPVLRGKVQ